MQAKDLDDEAVVAAVRSLANDGRHDGLEVRWVSRWELEPLFPGVPEKVILAKLRRLIKRRVLDGCGCGCRGDLEVL